MNTKFFQTYHFRILSMSDHPPKENTDTIEELVIRNSYEIVALVSLLEKKGILTRAEIVDEIIGT